MFLGLVGDFLFQLKDLYFFGEVIDDGVEPFLKRCLFNQGLFFVVFYIQDRSNLVRHLKRIGSADDLNKDGRIEIGLTQVNSPPDHCHGMV